MKIRQKKNSNFSMTATLVMLTYYIWYRFTYFKQIEPMPGVNKNTLVYITTINQDC